LGQIITDEIADEVIRASGEEAALALLILGEKSRAEGEEATNTQAIIDETTRALSISDMLYDKININKGKAETQRIRSVAADETLTTETERLADEQNQILINTTTYAFRVTSTLNTNQHIIANTRLIFNKIDLCTPLTSSYNTGTYKYICPIDGVYIFGFKAFINTLTDNFRLGIYQNSVLFAQGGKTSEVCILYT